MRNPSTSYADLVRFAEWAARDPYLHGVRQAHFNDVCTSDAVQALRHIMARAAMLTGENQPYPRSNDDRDNHPHTLTT